MTRKQWEDEPGSQDETADKEAGEELWDEEDDDLEDEEEEFEEEDDLDDEDDDDLDDLDDEDDEEDPEEEKEEDDDEKDTEGLDDDDLDDDEHLDNFDITCPYCGQKDDVAVDPDQPSGTSYAEDCAYCGRTMRLTLTGRRGKRNLVVDRT
jgi:hypothetical protein